VDKSDIKTITFDIFSKRIQFDYELNVRVLLYLGFLGKVFQFLRCRVVNFELMNRVNKLFDKAVNRLNKECDIVEMMDQTRKSKNF